MVDIPNRSKLPKKIEEFLWSYVVASLNQYALADA
jgi:hypothetical protein